jgi:hypothetical protein
MLVDPEQRIPLAAALQLLEESAEASGLADFGLRMAQARRLSDLGALGLLLTHLSSLRAVLQTLIHSRQLVGGTLALAMVETGKSTAIREELVGPAAARSRQATELVLGVLFRLCATLPGQRWNTQSVNFRHAAPADIHRHRQLFNCRLKFGSEFNGIVCATADLDGPNPLADPVLAAYARRLVDVPPSPGRTGSQNRAQGPVRAASSAGRRSRRRRRAWACTCECCGDGCPPTASPFGSWSTRSGATWCCASWPSPATA